MTFTVPDEVARRLEAAATARGVPVDQVVVEALTEWTEHHRADPAESPESFIGIGARRSDLAERHDDVLESFIGCAASGASEPFDIHRARAAAADVKLARGA